MSDTSIIETAPDIVPEKSGDSQVPVTIVKEETTLEKEKELARKSQAYFHQKEESLVKQIANVAKSSPDIIDSLPGITEEDKKFRDRVVKTYSAGLFDSYESYVNTDVSSVVPSEPIKKVDSIDDTIVILQSTMDELSNDEGKEEFKRAYNMLNPSIPHADRIKYVVSGMRNTKQPISITHSSSIRPIAEKPKAPDTIEERRAKRASIVQNYS